MGPYWCVAADGEHGATPAHPAEELLHLVWPRPAQPGLPGVDHCGGLDEGECDGALPVREGAAPLADAVRRKRATPRRREAPRFEEGDWDDATMILLARCGGRCEVCGKNLDGDGVRHHRMRRKDGGDRLANLMLIHDACHRDVHAHPQDSVDNGWICPTWSTPDNWPMLIRGRLWFLEDCGGKVPVE